MMVDFNMFDDAKSPSSSALDERTKCILFEEMVEELANYYRNINNVKKIEYEEKEGELIGKLYHGSGSVRTVSIDHLNKNLVVELNTGTRSLYGHYSKEPSYRTIFFLNLLLGRPAPFHCAKEAISRRQDVDMYVERDAVYVVASKQLSGIPVYMVHENEDCPTYGVKAERTDQNMKDVLALKRLIPIVLWAFKIEDPRLFRFHYDPLNRVAYFDVKGCTQTAIGLEEDKIIFTANGPCPKLLALCSYSDNGPWGTRYYLDKFDLENWRTRLLALESALLYL